MKKFLIIAAVILTSIVSVSAQKTDKFSQEIIIDCEDIQAAKMTSDETIYGKAKDMDITFPFKTRINPDKGAEIKLKAPGYKEYALIIPRGAFESYYMVVFTVDAKEMAKLNKEKAKVEKSADGGKVGIFAKRDYSFPVSIECDQVESAKVSGIQNLYGIWMSFIDVTFPYNDKIDPKYGAVMMFKAPGYENYKLVIPPGTTQNVFKIHFTENPKEMAKLRAQKVKVAPQKSSEPIATQSKPYNNGSVSVGKVSRDTPGKSVPEQTIIRWMVDSDPQGARIFYRVISSTHEVQNTNESYLLTTPYEETRSFNILGLTYENARDVQIEIKIMKPGYHTQVKRFNVRQALDQQEISTFFQLVKKEEGEN